VLPYPPQGLQHHWAGKREHREGEQEALDLPPHCRGIRPRFQLPQAGVGEFGEDLRRQGRATGTADAPEHLPGPIALHRLPPVQGVDEEVGVEEVARGHYLRPPHTRSS
jgi:hypothetical protein